MERRFEKAHIKWNNNPILFPVNEWMRDIVVNFGEPEIKHFMGTHGLY